MDQLNQGRTLQQISSAIKHSAEARYLAVDLAYQSVLGREGDTGGRLAWAQAMANGLTPDAMWIAMSHSQEHRDSGLSGDALYYIQSTDSNFMVATTLEPGGVGGNGGAGGGAPGNEGEALTGTDRYASVN